MENKNFPERKASEAEVLTVYYELKRWRPRGFLVVYSDRSDGDHDLVAIVDTCDGDEDRLRIVRAVIRAVRSDCIIVAERDAEAVQILEDGARRALSLSEWRFLFRTYRKEQARSLARNTVPRCSKRYRELFARAFGD